jgi:hypothetical protein
VLLGLILRSIFFRRTIVPFVHNEWFLRSFKPCVVRTFAGVPFLYDLCGAFVKLQWFANHRIKFLLVVFFYKVVFLLYWLYSPSVLGCKSY